MSEPGIMPAASRASESGGGFFRNFVASMRESTKSSNSDDSQDMDEDQPRHKRRNSLMRIVKHHSFSGHLPFRSQESNGGGKEGSSGGSSNNLLSKRPSLILPFNPGNQRDDHSSDLKSTHYEDFHGPISKSGVLIKQANHFKTWKKRLMVLKGHSLFYYVSGATGEDSYPRGVIPLHGVRISPIDASKFKRPHCFEICHPGYRPIYLMAKSEADLNIWMSSLTSAAMPTTADKTTLLITENVEKLFDTPALEDAVPYKRSFYFRKKVAFCLPRRVEDQKLSAADLFELNEKRLTTICDLNNYCDTFPMILGDPQLFKELLHAVSCYIFRPFPILKYTTPHNIFVDDSINDADGLPDSAVDALSEYTVEEQQWGLLSACYDLLLKAIEHIDKLEKQVRRDFFPLRFIAQLVNLFKSPSFKERQVLKTVLHRLYYKLTQRRGVIRKQIAFVFYEYIFETSNHYGVAELLEILGSIVNGFACPIKDEHIVLLEKALIPLHSTPAFISYHQQLAYCMIQYVSKDHSLFKPIAKGLLKYWPVGNSFKEVVFIVELEELLEHVLEEGDFANMAPKLARRLGMCMISEQFQVAERALSCWNSPACLRIMNVYEKLGQDMFNGVKPFLKQAMTAHWNAIIQQKAQETYTVYYNMGYEHGEVLLPSLLRQEVELPTERLTTDSEDMLRTSISPSSISGERETEEFEERVTDGMENGIDIAQAEDKNGGNESLRNSRRSSLSGSPPKEVAMAMVNPRRSEAIEAMEALDAVSDSEENEDFEDCEEAEQVRLSIEIEKLKEEENDLLEDK